MISTAIVAETKGLDRISWQSVPVPPTVPLIPEDDRGSLFKGEDSMVGGEIPYVKVFSKSGALVM